MQQHSFNALSSPVISQESAQGCPVGDHRGNICLRGLLHSMAVLLVEVTLNCTYSFNSVSSTAYAERLSRPRLAERLSIALFDCARGARDGSAEERRVQQSAQWPCHDR